jgi:hypothetical protein
MEGAQQVPEVHGVDAVQGQRQHNSAMGPDLSGKPARLFDREDEWSALLAFSKDPHARTGLGAVLGRPRQGKTLLLESVARATGGFYFGGQEATEAESLRRLGAEYARYRQVAEPSRWSDWKEAVDALLALGDSRPLPVIIDSFPASSRRARLWHPLFTERSAAWSAHPTRTVPA